MAEPGHGEEKGKEAGFSVKAFIWGFNYLFRNLVNIPIYVANIPIHITNIIPYLVNKIPKAPRIPKMPRIPKIRLGRFPYPGIEDPLRTKILKSVFELNEIMIGGKGGLSEIEKHFSDVSNFLWGRDSMDKALDDPKSLASFYSNTGPYDNPDYVSAEYAFLDRGTGLSRPSLNDFKIFPILREVYGQDIEEDVNKLRQIYRSSRTLPTFFHLDTKYLFFNGKTIEVICFGKTDSESIKYEFSALLDSIINQVGKVGAPQLSSAITTLRNTVDGLMSEISNIEKNETVDLFKKKAILTKIEGDRGTEVMNKRPLNVRFFHTYKIIRRLYIDDPKNPQKIELFETAKDTADFEVYPWEAGKGLDENGYPLEVDDDGTVLLDRWYKEIAENDWQMKRVKEKVEERHIGHEEWNMYDRLMAFKKGKYKIRRVDPKKWVENLNLLETAVYVLNEWDPYRDDFRDARYHPNSKTSLCYILADSIPSAPIHTHRDPTNPGDYIHATPEDFEHVPGDEKRVKRDYKIYKDNMKKEVLEEGKRQPRHLNPAFDRSALGFASAKGQPFIHWGRLYYYEDVGGVNYWSENPYPAISTRGIATYLIDRVFREEYTYEDARKALQYAKEGDVGYDYGVRQMGAPFSKDPLGGDLIHLRE